MNFKRVEDDVKPILKNSEAARADDMTLYAAYCYDKIKNYGYGVSWLQRIFSDRRFRIIHGIAPYATVSRVRRKIQAENENLRPSEEYQAERKRVEKEYKAYARQKGGVINE